jgi:hypothetical protein
MTTTTAKTGNKSGGNTASQGWGTESIARSASSWTDSHPKYDLPIGAGQMIAVTDLPYRPQAKVPAPTQGGEPQRTPDEQGLYRVGTSDQSYYSIIDLHLAFTD